MALCIRVCTHTHSHSSKCAVFGYANLISHALHSPERSKRKICSNGFCLFFSTLSPSPSSWPSLSLSRSSWLLWLLFLFLSFFLKSPYSLRPFHEKILDLFCLVHFALFFHHLKSRTLVILNQTMVLHLCILAGRPRRRRRSHIKSIIIFAWQSITITCSFIVQNTIADFQFICSVVRSARSLAPFHLIRVYKICVCTLFIWQI